MDEVAARLVAPFYLNVLHGNLTRLTPSEQDSLRAQMRAVATEVSLDDARSLWALMEWRCNIMASWWATVWGWPEAAVEVERLLLPSRLIYAGQGHCVALAGLATDDAAEVLCRYLDTYLAAPDKYYDQTWAMSALSIVDQVQGEHRAEERMGAWSQWVADKPHHSGAFDAVPTIRAMLNFASSVAST
ncbi:MAG: DUF6000 family protein [Actinomycetes bacterium]